MSRVSSRRSAVEILLKIHEQGGFSHIVLEEYWQKHTLPDEEKSLAVRLVYGVTERQLTVDFLLNRLSTTPIIKMDAPIREILRIGVYQLVFMHIPSFAAVNESVALTKEMGLSRLSGFVNAVLRKAERESLHLMDSLPSTDKGLEIRYSCPREWIRSWRDDYGEERMQELIACVNEAPPAYIRVNTVKISFDEFCRKLEQNGTVFHGINGLDNALLVDNPASLRQLPPEMNACFYFQDLASQWSCFCLGARPGERIADVCAAPGGKSFTLAQWMNNTGEIISSDLYEAKCQVMRQRARDYGLTCVHPTVRDASKPVPEELAGTFDRVLCDAPCSGLGVIRRKPEIRYKKKDDFASLPEIQYTILSRAAELVRVGGILQYSTCTLRKAENEEVAARFLAEHTNYKPRILPLNSCFEALKQSPSHEITLFPAVHGTDGFYIAGFERLAL